MNLPWPLATRLRAALIATMIGTLRRPWRPP
jgi:hypothetical protein